MIIPSAKNGAVPTRSSLGREALDMFAAIVLAGALALLLRARHSPMHLLPYLVLIPLAFGPILRQPRWQRVSFVFFVGIMAGLVASLSVIS